MPCCLELQPLHWSLAMFSRRRTHSSVHTAKPALTRGPLTPKLSNPWPERRCHSSGAQHLEPSELPSKQDGSRRSPPSGARAETGSQQRPRSTRSWFCRAAGARGSLRKPRCLIRFTQLCAVGPEDRRLSTAVSALGPFCGVSYYSWHSFTLVGSFSFSHPPWHPDLGLGFV